MSSLRAGWLPGGAFAAHGSALELSHFFLRQCGLPLAEAVNGCKRAKEHIANKEQIGYIHLKIAGRPR
ncbi:hypothetical protein ACQR1Y_33190 [Bradyrhizobium sp. HKCCYLRH3099]